MGQTPKGALYASGGEQEDIDVNAAYEEAQRKLLEALDARKNRLFDPVLLAMAQGFLAPTRTGSFGEALGNVAAKIGPAEAAQAAEDQKLAEMRLGLAQQGVAMQQEKNRQKAVMGILGEYGGATPVSSAPTAAKIPLESPIGAPSAPPSQPFGVAPAGGLPPAASAAFADKPPGMEGIVGKQLFPPNEDLARARRALIVSAQTDPSITPAELSKRLEEFARKRFEVKEIGTVDLLTGKLYENPKPIEVVPVDVQLRTIPGLQNQPIKVPTELARKHTEKLQEAMTSGKWGALREFEANLVRTAPAEEEVRAPSTDKRIQEAVAQAAGPVSTASGRIATQAEIESGAAASKETAMLIAKDRANRTAGAYETAQKAAESMPGLMQLQELAKGPNAEKIFGAFTNPKLLSQFVRLAETGVGMSGFNLGVPAIRDVANNLRLSPQEQRDLQLAGQLMIQMQLSLTPAERGGGSVTNFERELFAKSKITPDDTPDTVRTKIQGALRLAKYRQDLVNKLEQTGLQYDSFMRTPQGQRLFEDYLVDMRDLVGNLPTASPAAPKAPAKPVSPTGQKDKEAVKKLLGQ